MTGPRLLLHLARRFFGSLSPLPLDPADDAWIRSHLLPTEARLWGRMPRADRKHAAGVARTVAATLPDPDRAVIAAAALHDVGKVDADHGPFGRAAITVAAAIAGRERLIARGGRAARYLTHDVVGATMLEAAGSDPLTVAWAREHHLPRSGWTVPVHIGEVLSSADDD